MADAWNEWVQIDILYFFIIIYSYFILYLYLFHRMWRKTCKIIDKKQENEQEMENEFIAGRKNKSLLWGQMLNKIKEIDPEFNHS